VIGTAGRGNPILKKHWEFMKSSLRTFVARAHVETGRPIKLVSGGAAGGDHTAIAVAKELGMQIHLHLPTKDSERCMSAFKHYHAKFSGGVLGSPVESIRQLSEVTARGDYTEHGPSDGYKAFFTRNTAIAKEADWLIAFTFQKDFLDNPKGGTGDTWKKWYQRWTQEDSKGAVCLHILLK
jgi:hypothetical protein